MKNQRELGYVLRAVLICGMVYSPAAGEELRIGTNADWRCTDAGNEQNYRFGLLNLFAASLVVK